MAISSPLVANVLAIINLQMVLGNLPTAANCLPLVPIGNDMQVGLCICLGEYTRKANFEINLPLKVVATLVSGSRKGAVGA